MDIEKGREHDPGTPEADAVRDVVALLRAFLAPDMDKLTEAVIEGAEHDGMLRKIAYCLLGAFREPYLRWLLAYASLDADDVGRPVHVMLTADLDELLAAPGARETLDKLMAQYQARITGQG